jgi:glutamate-ammonia-ligase adenylyltransferase
MTHGLTFVSGTFASAENLNSLTRPADPVQARTEWERWRHAAAQADDPALAETMQAIEALPAARHWLDAIFGNSPFLTRLALRDPSVVASVLDRGPDLTLAELFRTLNAEDAIQQRAALMTRLRVTKRRAALIIALADIAGLWPLDRVTGALSDLADASLSAALRHLLAGAAVSGQIALAHPDAPERDSGVIILGMGKLGARELNYSSDIDLIVLFDADKITYRGPDSVSGLMARLTRDLVKLMEERTVDGYVFRTDLRLRPDPASTPPAVSVEAAETYYGSLGQNWERAALIKARPVAGDIVAGRTFLTALKPFLWRKHLDFAAIRDIHSIKRQIDARHGGSPANIAGHNVKLGHGGIREIEFFAQTQQLIWGGRLPALRSSATIETLYGLAEAGRIERRTADELAAAYRLLRRIEHRLQMIEDNQTHSLPSEPEALRRLAVFLDYSDTASFARELGATLTLVQGHFRELFRGAPALSDEGNLVFTGKDSDPETLATLARLGFKDPDRVNVALRGWHHGRLRATRSARARELLTELAPSWLRQLGSTADPDFAFTRFDEFLGHLSGGVQLFSLFEHHPELFGLVAEIMGEAPHLAVRLARKPLLLDAVLSEDFYGRLPEATDDVVADLRRDLGFAIARARDFEDLLDLTRRWAGDRKFQIGVQLLQGRIDGPRAGRDFTLVAETVIASLLPLVEAEFARAHGSVPGGEFVILGLGKLGSREMNVLSDLDLIFVYRHADGAEQSDGAKPLPILTYFARLGQRMINALAAPTGEGNLYEVDMRLRPSGNAGPIASSLESFRRYHDDQAWTWERMALTRARVIAGGTDLARDLEATIRAELTRRRDPAKLLGDVAEMRRRIAVAHPDTQTWDAKHRRGGLVDLEFIAQYLLLKHAPDDSSLLVPETAAAYQRLIDSDVLAYKPGGTLRHALEFWQHLQQVLRVTLGKVEGAPVTEDHVVRAVSRALGNGDAGACRQIMAETADAVQALYRRLIDTPAQKLAGAAATEKVPSAP